MNLNFSPFKQTSNKQTSNKQKSLEHLNFLPAEAKNELPKRKYNKFEPVFIISFLTISIILHMWFWIELGTGGGDNATPTGRIPKPDSFWCLFRNKELNSCPMMTTPLYFALIFSVISGVCTLIVLSIVIIRFRQPQSRINKKIVDEIWGLNTGLPDWKLENNRRCYACCSIWISNISLLLTFICILAANEWLKDWSRRICPLENITIDVEENFWSCDSDSPYDNNILNVTEMNITRNGKITGGTLMFDVDNLGSPNAQVNNDFTASIIVIVIAFIVGLFVNRCGTVKKNYISSCNF